MRIGQHKVLGDTWKCTVTTCLRMLRDRDMWDFEELQTYMHAYTYQDASVTFSNFKRRKERRMLAFSCTSSVDRHLVCLP